MYLLIECTCTGPVVADVVEDLILPAHRLKHTRHLFAEHAYVMYPVVVDGVVGWKCVSRYTVGDVNCTDDEDG
jgi:hypothetical protein